MTIGRLVRRGLRRLAGLWWRSVRPTTGAHLPGGRPARPEHETGRPPRPDERWLPSAPPAGPWAGVDPHATARLPRRGSVLAVVAWGAMVGWRVRRDVQAWQRDRAG